MRKFVRRNRGVVVAGGLVAGVLVIGLATTMWQARVASRERDAARASAKEAEQRRKETEQVAKFQAAQLGSIDPPGMGERVRADIVENARLLMVRDGVPAAEIEARRARLVGLLGDVNFTDIALRTLDASYFQSAIAAARRVYSDIGNVVREGAVGRAKVSGARKKWNVVKAAGDVVAAKTMGTVIAAPPRVGLWTMAR